MELIFLDAKFQGPQRHTIPQSWAPDLRGIGIDFVQFQWHAQKILENGETIFKARHPDPRLCPALASLRTGWCSHCLKKKSANPLET